MTVPAAESVVARIMGCGSSGGVPRIGNQWGACDPKDPRNRRRRCSLLITGRHPHLGGETRLVIDTGCDLREQLLDADVATIDAVFYTHAHADHTHGIDDLRGLALNARRRVDVYADQETSSRLTEAFGYCFVAPPGSDYPPILSLHALEADAPITVTGAGGTLKITPFLQAHGNIHSLGFRIGNFAYSCDLSGIPEMSGAAVSGLETWVLDALRYTPHPSHLHLSQSLDLVARYRPQRAVLTNLHVDLDYATLDAETPAHVRPAHDGLEIPVQMALS